MIGGLRGIGQNLRDTAREQKDPEIEGQEADEDTLAVDGPEDEDDEVEARPRGRGPRRPPAGKSMLFCVGAQKAGTTWLSARIGQHPDCHFAHYKEMHFFDAVYGDVKPMIRWQVRILRNRVERLHTAPRPNFRRKLDAVQAAAEMLDMYRPGPAGERAYVRLLTRGSGDARYLCDFTPDYAYMTRDVFETMAAFGERPRFIFILRDPVSRFWSQIRMRIGRMNLEEDARAPTARRMVEEWLGDGPLSRRQHNHYAHTLSMLEACVPEADRLEIFMEDLFTQAGLDRIAAFLGIAPFEADFAPEHVGDPLDLPDDLRSRIRGSLDDTYAFCRARYGDGLPARWATNG
ncbi:MAG: sulfotransferase [Pseudomonadota bacterium]